MRFTHEKVSISISSKPLNQSYIVYIIILTPSMSFQSMIHTIPRPQPHESACTGTSPSPTFPIGTNPITSFSPPCKSIPPPPPSRPGAGVPSNPDANRLLLLLFAPSPTTWLGGGGSRRVPCLVPPGSAGLGRTCPHEQVSNHIGSQ